MSRPQKEHRVGRLNDHLWNGGHHGCRILILNLDRHRCLWRLDRRQLDRRCLAFGLAAHGIAYRHCGFDQPLSSNSRSQNRVAEPEATEALLMAAEDRGYECWEGCRPSDNGRIRCQGCRADLLKLPHDCSDCMTCGHRLLRVCRAYPFHRTETELERSESVDGLERSATFASTAVARHGASQLSAKRLRKCAFAQIPPA
jgi:hypothetical protein